MNIKEQPTETKAIRGGSKAWMALSFGAILGVLASLILARSQRLKELVRGMQLRTRPAPAGESTGSESASLETALPYKENLNRAAVDALPAAILPGAAAPGKPPKTSKAAGTNVASPSAAGDSRWSSPTRYIMGVFLFFAVLVVLYIGRSAVSLVIAASLLALFVDPLIGFLSRRFRMKRSLAVGITYLLVVAVLLLVPLLLIPSLVETTNFVMDIDTHLVAQRLSEVVQSIGTALRGSPGLAAALKPTLDSLIKILNDLASTVQPEDPAVQLSATELTSQFGKALGILSKVLGPTFSVLASLFFTLIISLQMTLTASEVKNWYADLIPPRYSPELSWIFTNTRQIWTGFLRGQMTLMLLIGLIIWLGGLILGLPQALLLGIIAGVMELIPNIGPILAAIPAVILALLFGSTNFALNNLVFALLVVGFYALVQLVENQYFVPRIMGEAVDLPPLIVLIGTIAGAGAFGIMGALLATPVIATGNLVFRYIYRKILEDYFVAPLVEVKPGFMDKVRGFMSRLRLPNSRKK